MLVTPEANSKGRLGSIHITQELPPVTSQILLMRLGEASGGTITIFQSKNKLI